MLPIEHHRRIWNAQQQNLQDALKHPDARPDAIDLFLSQHAALHAREVSGMQAGDFSFAEAIWEGLSEAAARRVVGEHSIAWIFWHLARIEDMTMNVLLAGAEQVFAPAWSARLGVDLAESGNLMPAQRIADLSARVDLAALRAYRSAVGRRTREHAATLTPALLKQNVDPARIERLRQTGHVLPEADELLDYWSKRTIAGLLLMPPTRHNLVHLNEADRLKSWLSS